MLSQLAKLVKGLIPTSRVVKVLIASDFFFLFGWGLVTPILAIFILESIQGGDAKVAGIAIGIYWLGKSIIQIPIAKYLDKNHGEKDDYYALIAGTLLGSLVPLGFIFATLPWHMYALQGVHALGAALGLPAWSAIFTRHLSKGQEAFSWGLDSSALGIGAGTAGIIGGMVAKTFGFLPLFIGVSILGLIATSSFLLIKKDLLPKTPKEQIYPLPKP
jgi:MFS family permease